jgi:hypothetical protein
MKDDEKIWRYIGSTIQSLRERHYCHKNLDCNSRIIFKRFGYDNCNIELIEEIIVSDIKKLREREGYYIKLLDCVNTKTPGRTKREYYEDNREDIAQSKKEWREKNKQKIKEQKATKITCICGSITDKSHKARHEHSQHHLAFINQLPK